MRESISLGIRTFLLAPLLLVQAHAIDFTSHSHVPFSGRRWGDSRIEADACAQLLSRQSEIRTQAGEGNSRHARRVLSDRLLDLGEGYGEYMAIVESLRDAILAEDFDRAGDLFEEAGLLLGLHGSKWVPPSARRYASGWDMDAFGAIQGLRFSDEAQLAEYLQNGGEKEFRDFGLQSIVLNSHEDRESLAGSLLPQILSWPALKRLNLTLTELDRKALEALAQAKHLKSLELNGVSTRVGNFRPSLGLVDLSLRDVYVPFDELEAIAKLPHLKRLALKGTVPRVLEGLKGAKELVELRLELSVLDLPEEIFASFPKLRIFHFDGVGEQPRLAGAPAMLVRALSSSPSLVQVDLRGFVLSTDDTAVLAGIPTLQGLKISGVPWYFSAAPLFSSASLKRLSLTQSSQATLDPTILDVIRKSTSVNFLELDDWLLDYSYLKALAHSRSVRKLNIFGKDLDFGIELDPLFGSTQLTHLALTSNNFQAVDRHLKQLPANSSLKRFDQNNASYEISDLRPIKKWSSFSWEYERNIEYYRIEAELFP